MSKFFPLKVAEVKRETADTVSVILDLPQEQSADFKYKQGQYLTFKIKIGNEEVRRSYSLCSSPYSGEKMRVAVKEVNKKLLALRLKIEKKFLIILYFLFNKFSSLYV